MSVSTLTLLVLLIGLAVDIDSALASNHLLGSVSKKLKKKQTKKEEENRLAKMAAVGEKHS